MNKLAAAMRYAELLQRVPAELKDFDKWSLLDLATIKAEHRPRYHRLCKATRLFLSGQPIIEVVKVAGMPAYRFCGYFENALKPWLGGGYTGTRAFASYCVQKPRTRIAPRKSKNPMGGYAGYFGLLLRERPQIEVELTAFLKGKQRPNVVSPKVLRDKFINLCIDHGVKADEYPRCVHDQGHKPLMDWYQKVFLAAHALTHVRLNHGAAAAEAAGHEMGDGQSRTPTIAYVTWAFDEFDANLNSKVEIPSERWNEEIVQVDHFPVLRCRSLGNYAVNIGWHMCIGKAATGADVIKLLRNCVLGQPEPAMFDPDMVVAEGAGFPQNLFPELRYVVPITIYLDNALAHLLSDLQHVVERLFGGRVLLGIPGKPKGRPEIESHIGHTMAGLLKQLPGTLGSGPLDPTRKQAEGPVAKYLHVNHVEQAIHVRLANENVSDAAASGYLDGFTRLKSLLQRGAPNFNRLLENKREGYNFCAPKRRTVKCDLKNGRLPHINFGDRRYSSDWLRLNPALRGKDYWILVDYDDLRTVVMCDDNMMPVQILRCGGEWGRVPHDLRIWRIYCRRKRDARFKFQPRDVPLYCVLRCLAEGARTDHSFAQDYAYFMKYLKSHLSESEIAAFQVGELENGANDDEFIPEPAATTPSAETNKFEGASIHTLPSPEAVKRRFALPRRLS